KLFLDAGAVEVLEGSGRSLLPVGVAKVTGRFLRGDLVDCVAIDSGRIVARGLVNYSAEESAKIAGRASGDIERILGFVDEPEIVHRDNMVVL
ncbi:MAG: glutamate 5-kinase, partial [Proteobacteria bacterium]|nr:glutamate 5-kinase [Pseudomonadota bacterium]